MNVLSRDFTLRERILLLILALILLGLLYYQVVDIPTREGVARANAERDASAIELTAVEGRIARLEQMREEIDRLGSLSEVSRMDSYNNSKAELAALNGILEAADAYSIAFANVTRNGDQVRRNFSLQFTAGSYDTVKGILRSLSRSEYRCLLGDVSYAESRRGDTGAPVITVSTTATFFETMYDGTPDAGLPAAGASGG